MSSLMNAVVPHYPRKVISYAPLEVASVEEMMEPNKPLVKSCLPVTKPKGPSFETAGEMQRRQKDKKEKRMQEQLISMRMNLAAEAERKVLKAQLEIDRERRTAQQCVYRMARVEESKRANQHSPFLADLAAEADRAEVAERARMAEEKRRQQTAEKKKQELHTAIVKAAIEVDEAEERRRLHRQNLESAKIRNSFKDVLRSEMTGTKRCNAEELLLRTSGLSRTCLSPMSHGSPTAIPREEPITEQAARQVRKDIPVYIAQRQDELAQRARLEVESKEDRERRYMLHEEAEEIRAVLDVAERERQRLKKERHERRKAAEIAHRRKVLQEARQQAEEQTRQELELEETKQKIREVKKHQLMEEWRAQALRNKKPEEAQFKQAALFPTPPRSLLKKTPPAAPPATTPPAKKASAALGKATKLEADNPSSPFTDGERRETPSSASAAGTSLSMHASGEPAGQPHDVNASSDLDNGQRTESTPPRTIDEGMERREDDEGDYEQLATSPQASQVQEESDAERSPRSATSSVMSGRPRSRSSTHSSRTSPRSQHTGDNESDMAASPRAASEADTAEPHGEAPRTEKEEEAASEAVEAEKTDAEAEVTEDVSEASRLHSDAESKVAIPLPETDTAESGEGLLGFEGQEGVTSPAAEADSKDDALEATSPTFEHYSDDESEMADAPDNHSSRPGDIEEPASPAAAEASTDAEETATTGSSIQGRDTDAEDSNLPDSRQQSSSHLSAPLPSSQLYSEDEETDASDPHVPADAPENPTELEEHESTKSSSHSADGQASGEAELPLEGIAVPPADNTSEEGSDGREPRRIPPKLPISASEGVAMEETDGTVEGDQAMEEVGAAATEEADGAAEETDGATAEETDTALEETDTTAAAEEEADTMAAEETAGVTAEEAERAVEETGGAAEESNGASEEADAATVGEPNTVAAEENGGAAEVDTGSVEEADAVVEKEAGGATEVTEGADGVNAGETDTMKEETGTAAATEETTADSNGVAEEAAEEFVEEPSTAAEEETGGAAEEADTGAAEEADTVAEKEAGGAVEETDGVVAKETASLEADAVAAVSNGAGEEADAAAEGEADTAAVEETGGAAEGDAAASTEEADAVAVEEDDGAAEVEETSASARPEEENAEETGKDKKETDATAAVGDATEDVQQPAAE